MYATTRTSQEYSHDLLVIIMIISLIEICLTIIFIMIILTIIRAFFILNYTFRLSVTK